MLKSFVKFYYKFVFEFYCVFKRYNRLSNRLYKRTHSRLSCKHAVISGERILKICQHSAKLRARISIYSGRFSVRFICTTIVATRFVGHQTTSPTCVRLFWRRRHRLRHRCAGGTGTERHYTSRLPGRDRHSSRFHGRDIFRKISRLPCKKRAFV